MIKIKRQSGFSLVEMLVTVGIFSIVAVVSSSIFININNMQQQTGNLQRLQNEGRYLLEKIAREVRGRELDYNATILLSGGLANTLYFKPDEFGDVMSIGYNKTNQEIDLTLNNTTERLNSQQVDVENLQFWVNPTIDPYSPSSSSTQPRVTVIMKLKNHNVIDRYLKHLNLQTTISSKIYK